MCVYKFNSKKSKKENIEINSNYYNFSENKKKIENIKNKKEKKIRHFERKFKKFLYNLDGHISVR